MIKKFINCYLIFYEKSCIDKIDLVKLAWRLEIHKNKLYIYILIQCKYFFFLYHFLTSFKISILILLSMQKL